MRTALRAALLRLLLAALLVPTVYPLAGADPDWLLGIDNERRAAHRSDGSDLPGAPGHPADHHCFPCQVLKYLAHGLPVVPLTLATAERHARPSAECRRPQCSARPARFPASRAPPASV